MPFRRSFQQQTFRRPMRRQRSGFVIPRKPISTSYVSTAAVNIISTATSVDSAILQTDDSPDKSIVTAYGSTVSRVENNSRVVRRGSFLRLNAWCVDDPVLFTMWVYKNPRGSITAPATANDFNLNPLTEDYIQLRKNTIFYWRGLLNAQEVTRFRVPLWSKRNSFLLDNTTLRLYLANSDATNNVNYMLYGRIRTVEG